MAVSFFITDTPPVPARARFRVRFDLIYSDGSQDEIVVFQPIGAPVPSGLIPADVTADVISIGGDIITIGGEPIHA